MYATELESEWWKTPAEPCHVSALQLTGSILSNSPPCANIY